MMTVPALATMLLAAPVYVGGAGTTPVPFLIGDGITLTVLVGQMEVVVVNVTTSDAGKEVVALDEDSAAEASEVVTTTVVDGAVDVASVATEGTLELDVGASVVVGPEPGRVIVTPASAQRT